MDPLTTLAVLVPIFFLFWLVKRRLGDKLSEMAHDILFAYGGDVPEERREVPNATRTTGMIYRCGHCLEEYTLEDVPTDHHCTSCGTPNAVGPII